MSNCWQILEIQPTHDLRIVSGARRRLMRRYHPDTVANPVEKQQFTTLSATINAAHDEAVHLAEVRQRLLTERVGAPRATAVRVQPVRYWSLAAPLVPVASLILLAFVLALPWLILVLLGFAMASGVDWVLHRRAVKPFFARSAFSSYRQYGPCLLLLGINLLIVGTVDPGEFVAGPHGGPLFNAGVILVAPAWAFLKWCRGTPAH